MRAIVFALLLACAPFVSSPAFADKTNDWLVGKWELSYDPDGGKKDWLEFGADGAALSISATGRRVSGQYVVGGDAVRVLYLLDDLPIAVRFTYSDDRNKLFLYSERTRNTAVYEKTR